MEDTVLANSALYCLETDSANTVLRDGGDFTFQVSINMEK